MRMPVLVGAVAQPISLGDGLGHRLKLSLISCDGERRSAGIGLVQAVLAIAGHGCSAVLKETPPASWNYPGQPVGKLGWIAGD
jgi:hypothetical protein